MGTSSSSSGPKGQTPLLPSWATGNNNKPSQGQDQNSNSNGDTTKGGDSKKSSNQNTAAESNNQYYSLTTVKGSLKRIVNKRKGASFKSAGKSYVRKTGGHRSATLSSAMGVITGSNYLGFFSGAAKDGLEQTLRNFDLSNCIGKSTEEAFAKIANKIAPKGSTNDEAIARAAVMIAFDKVYEKFIENDKDINSLDHLDEETLGEIVIEFVSAYIFGKWVYEAGLALERNDLSESQVIDLENEMRVFVTGEVKSGLEKVDILSLDITAGEGHKVIEDIFDLAYSTLEK
jgi:hypothetical protein